MDESEIISIFESVEEKMINKETLGFDPDILDVLDNVEASNQEIEILKLQISNAILMLVFNIANSAYYRNIRKGKISCFYEVITQLGMHHVKVLIIILALKILAKDDKDIEIIFIRSIVSAVFGKILAGQFGMREDSAKRVELGGLFSEIGKMFFLLYKKLYAPDDERLDESFVNKYHPYMAERIIERFSLPDYLKQIVFSESIVVQENYITVSGITRLAIDYVATSFAKFDNQLVIEVLPPSVSGRDESMSLANIIENQFSAVGLSNYLRIIKNKERLLPEYEYKKEE